MKQTANIKIDQLRLNIPYEYVNRVECNNGEIPNEAILADKLLHLNWLFHETSAGKGHNGYTTSYNFGSDTGVSVMWNQARKDMGILIEFTASGKALYESLAEMHGLKVDWYQIIKKLYKEYDGHLSRIDIATDLMNYGFSVNDISLRLKDQKSYFLNAQGNKISSNRFKIVGTTNEAQTLYVGSRKSDAFLRIYDKKIEQSRPDGLYRTLARECTDWVRVESEFKHRLAKEIGTLISGLNTDNIYPYLVGCVLERWSLVDSLEE